MGDVKPASWVAGLSGIVRMCVAGVLPKCRCGRGGPPTPSWVPLAPPGPQGRVCVPRRPRHPTPTPVLSRSTPEVPMGGDCRAVPLRAVPCRVPFSVGGGEVGQYSKCPNVKNHRILKISSVGSKDMTWGGSSSPRSRILSPSHPPSQTEVICGPPRTPRYPPGIP